MKPQEYGLDDWQIAILGCFHLSLKVIPTMSGVLYENCFDVISAYAYDKGFNAIEVLSICQRLKSEFIKK